MRNTLSLVISMLFVFSGRAFGLEDLKQPVQESVEILSAYLANGDGPQIEPQGSESGLNTYYGQHAGLNSSGASNSFFGNETGRYNLGDYNTAAGLHAGMNNRADNVCLFGSKSGVSNQGANNSFFGTFSGTINTTGAENTFVGAYAGYQNKIGEKNTLIGYQAGLNNNGKWNTFNGARAGYWNLNGYWNTCVGIDAGYSAKGSYNVFLGARAGYHETGSHKLYIDSTDTATPLIWGDFNTKEVRIHGGFKATASYMSSDQRWKKNIQPLESSLDKISNLQGVSYEWKIDAYPDVGMTEGKQIGLVAQDVESVLPGLVSEDKDGYKAVSYTKLTAVLVEAVKELKSENQKQKELLETQKVQFQKQQAEIEELRTLIKQLDR